MSVPAWKQAIIARKKQQEEAERKKQLEKEQYLASLPPWKRAMLMKKKEESAKTVLQTPKEEPHRSSPLVKPKIDRTVPAWKQRQDSAEKVEKVVEEPVHNEISTEKSREPAQSTKKISITQSMRGRFEQPQSNFVRKSEEKPFKVEKIKPPPLSIERKDNAEKKDTEEKAEIKKPDESLKPSREIEKNTDEVSSDKTHSGLHKLRGQFEQPSSSRGQPAQAKAQIPIDIDDEKLKSMPKWKQDLILRKRQQQEKTSPKLEHQKQDANKSPVAKNPPVSFSQTSSSPVSKNPPVSITSSPLSKTPPVLLPQTTQKDKKAADSPPRENKLKKEAPEIVNASDKAEPDSPKLLHKEGKELRPPVYKVKNKWADMQEDDPEFTNLPEWKRTLIMRRKSDFKTRTTPLPKEEKKEEKPKKEEKNEPLPAPLWTPTRSVTTREIPKETEKVEETNPLLDMRKNLRKVSRPQKEEKKDVVSQPLNLHNRKVEPLSNTHSTSGNKPAEDMEEVEEALSPLKSTLPKQQSKRVRFNVAYYNFV